MTGITVSLSFVDFFNFTSSSLRCRISFGKMDYKIHFLIQEDPLLNHKIPMQDLFFHY